MTHPHDMPHTVTALAWCDVARAWTKPVTYRARNKAEAENWAKFNRDYMMHIKITSDAMLAALERQRIDDQEAALKAAGYDV
jgi:hypothetical protein